MSTLRPAGSRLTGRRILPSFTAGTTLLAPVIGGRKVTTPSWPPASVPPWRG